MATEIRITGPRSEVDEALREVLYGSAKFTINRIVDGLSIDTDMHLGTGERMIVLDYPRTK